jgi:IS5 family transposase
LSFCGNTKVFAVTDAEKGYIERVAGDSGKRLGMRNFRGGYPWNKGQANLCGQRFTSNRELLKNSSIKNRIMYAAKKNKPLSDCQKLFNRLVSAVRFKVEQAFGTLKHRFSFVRARYFKLEKIQGQCLLKSLAFNLLKAANAC